MLVDMACFIALIFTSSLPSFLVPSALQALGGGASPAMQSLALSLAPPHHAGKVLASLSVLQSVMTSVLGPLIFGLLYAATVGTFPEAIFVLGAAVFATSSAFLLLVRLKKPVHPSSGRGAAERTEENRGRSPSPKQLRRAPSDADSLSKASASAFVLRGRVHPTQEENSQPQPPSGSARSAAAV